MISFLSRIFRLKPRPRSVEKAVAPGMSEEAMRDATVPTPKTRRELDAYIHGLVDRQHDYGTCVYAMSMAAVAAYNYVAHQLGVTGFQASCADLDILKRTRGMKYGFRLVDYENLLYPQYADKIHGYWDLVAEQRDHLRVEAKRLLAEGGQVAPEVRRHWEFLAQ